MKHKKGTIFIALGLLLVLGAAGLLGYNLWDDNRAGQSVETVITRMEEMIPPRGEPNLPEGRIPDYILAPEMEMPTVEVEDNDYIGYISIPAIDIELPVMAEWSTENLKNAPCRYAGSAYLDDMVVCAHNYTRHFGKLSRLHIGDRVEFVDIDGNLFVYEVAEKEQLEPSEAQRMLAGDWALSLFTCTIGGQYRTTIRCERVE